MREVYVFKQIWPARECREEKVDYRFAMSAGDGTTNYLQQFAYGSEIDLADGLHQHGVFWEEVSWKVPNSELGVQKSLDSLEKEKVFDRYCAREPALHRMVPFRD